MRASMPLISVVIPCYNAARYIESTLRSVLAQDWTALEVIVVDDGSKDGSAELVRHSFPSVTVVEQPNQGVAAARNHGIRRARGEWVAFVDADDIWLPGKLSAQMAAMAAFDGARMSYTAWWVWSSSEPDPEPETLQAVAAAADQPHWGGPSGWIYPQLLLDCEVWTSTVLMQRSLLDEIGNFDTTLRIGEDYDLWLRASRVTPILRVARPLALYRQHPASITRSAPGENYRGVVVARALQRWGYGQAQAPEADRAAVRRALAKSWSDFAVANLAAGRLDRARRGAWMALRTDPSHTAGWKALVKTALGVVVPRREVHP